MSSARKVSVLKCKSCNDMVLTSSVTGHHCFKTNKEIHRSQKTRKSYSIDRHCAVLDDHIPCGNHITCKVHSIEQKNEVRGRIYSVEDLIRMLKREKNKEKEMKVEKKEKLDEDLKKKAISVVKCLKPVVEYKFVDQKFTREFKEIRAVFMALKKEQQNNQSLPSTPVEEKANKKVGLATRKYKQRGTKPSINYKH